MIHPPAEREIAGRVFQISKKPVLQQIELKARILKVLGPAAESLPEILAGRVAEDATAKDKATSDGKAVEAIIAIFGRNDPKVFTALLADVVSMAKLQTQSGSWLPVSIERDFNPEDREDAMTELYTLFYYVLEEQFRSFFSGLMGLTTRLGLTVKV